MMVTLEITEKDVINCLHKYGLSDRLKVWKILADGPDHPVPYDVIRKIIYIELENGEKLVMKLVREPVFSTEIIENQSAFSDLLMEYGIETPKRKKVQGKYCVFFEKDNLIMDVYIEEWVGEKIPHLTMELYKKTGAVIGRILEIYNRRLAIIKKVWTELPRAAVQGDIYSCNNIANRDGNLVVYDFNLAGDEVLIGDILQCWFRTVFDEKIEEDLEILSKEKMWSEFIQAYQSERKLTDIEKKYLPDVYAILGVVYYSKILNYWMDKGECLRAKENYPYLLELLNTNMLPCIS